MRVAEAFGGKVCVVTGAASGIGLAVTEGLLRAGARVVLADRDADALGAAVQRLAAHGERIRSQLVDVTDCAQVTRLIESAVSWGGCIDILFNNAGIGGTLPIGRATMEHWRRIVDVNLWGVIHGVQAVLPVMRRQGGGTIVNTASISGIIPVPGQALYNTTKYAVVGLSESLRIELADEGIHVSVVCPGPVVSAIWSAPILGPRSEGKPPANAVTAESAARTILAGVARGAGIIALPARERWSWRVYRWFPGLAERSLRTMARERREGAKAAAARRTAG